MTSESQPPPTTAPPNPSSSPPKPKTYSSNPKLLANPILNKELRVKVAAEMRGYFVEPLPVQEFLDNFMPSNAATPVPRADFSEVSGLQGEAYMYQPFVRISRYTLSPGTYQVFSLD